MINKQASYAADEGVEIQALAVAIKILDLVASTRSKLSAADIARALNMTPPRVWRHLKSMQSLGLLEIRPGERGFVLGGKLVQYGQRAVDHMNIADMAYRHLEALRDARGESVYLAVPHREGGIVVSSLNGVDAISLHLAIGTYFPGHGSASGRVLMAFSSPERIQRFLALGIPTDRSPDPIMDPKQLAARFELIRERFFDAAQTEHARPTLGGIFINGIAAPVFNHRGEIAAAVGILTGLRGMQEVAAANVLEPLFACAAAISSALGSTRWTEASVTPPTPFIEHQHST